MPVSITIPMIVANTTFVVLTISNLLGIRRMSTACVTRNRGVVVPWESWSLGAPDWVVILEVIEERENWKDLRGTVNVLGLCGQAWKCAPRTFTPCVGPSVRQLTSRMTTQSGAPP